LSIFEGVYLRNNTNKNVKDNNNKDFDTLMNLDISKNDLSDSSIKYLADIIRKFHAFRSLNLSGLLKMKESGFVEFARALKDSLSLIEVNLSKNSMT
jgi:hypothetical protein